MTHALKTWPEYFSAIEQGTKTFELRKDDRPFQIGDKLLLQEWEPASKAYTGGETIRIIDYILRDAVEFGLRKGFVIIGFKEPYQP
jgi:hypothetical protein